MPIRNILVDGYNLIGAVSTLNPARLEASRKHLLDRAAQYVLVRGHRVTVVFDGAASADIQAPRWARRGVREVFSRPGEKADAWLVDEAAALHGECVVVTNDRAVAQGCERSGAVILGCEAFDEAMRRAAAEGVAGKTGAAASFPPGKVGAVPAFPPATPSLSKDDRDAWQSYAFGIKPLDPDEGREGPRVPRAKAGGGPALPPNAGARRDPRGKATPVSRMPDPAPRVPDTPTLRELLEAMMDVPDAVVDGKRADEPKPPRPMDRASREERHRRNVLKDL